MKKKIYLKPVTEEFLFPSQPLLAGSPINKTDETTDDFDDLLSREFEDFILY